MNSGEGHIPLANGLELIAQQHKPCIDKVPGKGHQLRLCVILHLIDADILRRAVTLARQRHAKVEPLDGGQLLFAQEALSDVLDVQPAALPDHLKGAAVVVLQAVFVLLGKGAHLCRCVLIRSTALLCLSGLLVVFVLLLVPKCMSCLL